MSTIQLGFVIPSENREKWRRATLVDDLNRALDLIEGHFDSAWMVDHLQFGDMDVLEGFTALTFLSAYHPKLKFGNAVLCQSFRNPAHLAKMTATLQFMSGGRAVLGLGAGWHEEEFIAYGYDFPPASVRVDQLEEALQIIRSLWQEESTTFKGRYHRVIEARCEPRPDPLPPIMIGAFKRRMLGLVARYADGWNVSSTSPARYRAMMDLLDQICEEIGRDPASIRRSWIGGCACAARQEQAIELAEDRWSSEDEEDFGFVGTPDQVLDQMQPFVKMGVDTFMFDCGGFPSLTTLEMLISEVIPRLKDLEVDQSR